MVLDREKNENDVCDNKKDTVPLFFFHAARVRAPRVHTHTHSTFQAARGQRPPLPPAMAPLATRGAGAPSAASTDRTAEFLKLATAAQAARVRAWRLVWGIGRREEEEGREREGCSAHRAIKHAGVANLPSSPTLPAGAHTSCCCC